MLRNAFLVFIFALIAISSACTATDAPNKNANTNVAVANQTNLPAEFSTEPVQPSGNTTPGIPDPANANNFPKGATPTPGIPDPTKMTPVPKGATPTPGIPDEATLKKQSRTLPMSSDIPATTNSDSNVNRRVRKP